MGDSPCTTPGGEDPAQGAAVNKWQQTGLPKLKHIILQRTGHTPGTAIPTVLHVDYKGDWLPLSVCSIAQQNLPAWVKGSETRCQGAHWCSCAEVIHHSFTAGNSTVSLGPLPGITKWGNPAGWGPCGGIFLYAGKHLTTFSPSFSLSPFFSNTLFPFPHPSPCPTPHRHFIFFSSQVILSRAVKACKT